MAVFAIIVILIAAFPVIKTMTRAISLMHILGMGDPPAPLMKMIQHPVIISHVRFETPNGPIEGILYQPGGRSFSPGMVMVHGFAPLGARYDRLVDTASGFASTGFTVFTPQLPMLTRYRVETSSLEAIGESAKWLEKMTNSPVSGMGVSFGAGLMLAAAADPRYSRSFRMVMSVSGYDDLGHLTEFYLTGKELLPNGKYAEYQLVDRFGTVATALQHLNDRVPAEDVSFVESALVTWLHGDHDIDHLTAGASERQADELRDILSFSQSSIQKTRETLKAHIGEQAVLSPHEHLKDLKIPVIVIHGIDDITIPAGEGLWLIHDSPTLADSLITPVVAHASFKPIDTDGWAGWFRSMFQKLKLVWTITHAMRLADPEWYF